MKSCPDCKATYPDDYAICPRDGAPLHETTLWQIGTVILGKYRIKARLGEGGMAIVYKAHHELLDEFRALKVIKPELARDAEFMTRFKNEAIMARKLNHPNAVRVDDLDIAEDGLPFIAMELIIGDTLNTLLERAGPLPVSLVLDVTGHVCEALDAAHKLGLIHRDIKPDNIVLIAQREGPPTAKILDFGISRLREETAGSKGLTKTGMVIGTPEYMSPEQALGKRGKAIDGRSDLYSLGVVMYRMLTGQLPFHAETTVEMMLQHLKAPLVPPGKLKPDLAIPDAVSLIVMKAMEKDREKRFATGAEMAAAIKKSRGSTTIQSPKIDWDSLSSSSASFGTEKGGTPGDPAPPVRPPARSGTPSPPPTAAPPVGGEIYKTSARIGPPRKEFPTQMVVRLLGVLILAGCVLVAAFFGWKHFSSAPPATPSPSAVPPVTAVQPSTPQKNLTYSDQAKIKELDSLAAIDERHGGCEKALPVYQQVLEIDPTDPRAYAGLQRCFAKARSAPAPSSH